MTTVFNHSLVKGKKSQLMLHLWKAQTYMASGVEAGITAFGGRLAWPTCSVGVWSSSIYFSLWALGIGWTGSGCESHCREQCSVGCTALEPQWDAAGHTWPFPLCTAPVANIGAWGDWS